MPAAASRCIYKRHERRVDGRRARQRRGRTAPWKIRSASSEGAFEPKLIAAVCIGGEAAARRAGCNCPTVPRLSQGSLSRQHSATPPDALSSVPYLFDHQVPMGATGRLLACISFLAFLHLAACASQVDPTDEKPVLESLFVSSKRVETRLRNCAPESPPPFQYLISIRAQPLSSD